MVSVSTMNNYINKYIKKLASPEARNDYFWQLKAFLFMNVSNCRDKSPEVYQWGEELYRTEKEFRDLVVGCLGNMKRVYGNSEKYNFDKIYKELNESVNEKLGKEDKVEYSTLDEDFKALPAKYNKAKVKVEEEAEEM